MSLIALAFAFAQAAAPSTASPPTDVEAHNAARLATAEQLLRDRQPQAALDVVTIVLADYEADHASEKRRLYCAMSSTETLLYLAAAAKDGTSAVALAPGYCTALYVRSFALVDLGRIAEAEVAYQRLLTFAPMHAPYFTELGQTVRLDKDWPRMLSLCEKAESAAALAPAELRNTQQGAALRCQGFALVEQKKWTDAEKRYQAALKLDPADAKAQGELRYIAEHRKG